MRTNNSSIARSARDRSQPRVQEDRKGEGGWDEKAEAAAAKQSKQSRESDAMRTKEAATLPCYLVASSTC